METKHTPGPWTQGRSEQGRSCVWLAGEVEPAREMGLVSKWIDCNTEGNARLIAAAPDLLAALIDAVDLIETISPLEGNTLRNARAAITKATDMTANDQVQR